MAKPVPMETDNAIVAGAIRVGSPKERADVSLMTERVKQVSTARTTTNAAQGGVHVLAFIGIASASQGILLSPIVSETKTVAVAGAMRGCSRNTRIPAFPRTEKAGMVNTAFIPTSVVGERVTRKSVEING